MADWRTFFAGKYLSAPLLEGDVTFIIDRVVGADVENPDDKSVKWRMTIHWRGKILPWLPSKTAGYCLAAMYGDDTDGWHGKPVTIYNDATVRVMGKTVGGIRVRGAPDIKPITIEIKHPGRKKQTVNLVNTRRSK